MHALDLVAGIIVAGLVIHRSRVVHAIREGRVEHVRERVLEFTRLNLR